VLDAHAPECRPRFAQSRLVLHVRDDFEAPLDDVSIVVNTDPALAERTRS
jgi:hypothetical protein